MINTIKAGVSVLPPDADFSERSLTKRIEAVGRRCYKSEDKTTEDSCFGFAKRMVKSGHEAMVEHASLLFELHPNAFEAFRTVNDQLELTSSYKSYLRFTSEVYQGRTRCVVSGNIRAWRSHLHAYAQAYEYVPSYFANIVEAYPSLFPEYQTKLPSLRDTSFKQITVDELVSFKEHLVHHDITVLFICDRGVSHECVRHRDGSFAQESTRYCNYANEKFGQAVSFIDINEGIRRDKKTSALPFEVIGAIVKEWEQACKDSAKHYFNMIELGASPQIARSVLNNSTKTELCMTFSVREWRHFSNLRALGTTGAPHPQMVEVAEPLLIALSDRYPELFGDLGRVLDE